MYCPKCGKETEQSGKFCQWCGTELEEIQDRPFPRKRVGTIKTEKFSGLAGRFLGGLIDLVFLVLFDLLAAVVIGIFAWFAARPDPVSETIRMINQYYHHLLCLSLPDPDPMDILLIFLQFQKPGNTREHGCQGSGY
jgi:hypothetical protein